MTTGEFPEDMKGKKRETDKRWFLFLIILFCWGAWMILANIRNIRAEETTVVGTTEKSEEEMIQTVLGEREEIVRVESVCWDGDSKIYRTKSFSGFVVSNGTNNIYVVTVRNDLQYTTKEIAEIKKEFKLESDARLSEKTEAVFGGDLRVEVEVVGESEQRNLILLHLSQSVSFDKTSVFARENVSDKERVFLMAYPENLTGENAVYSIENVRLTAGTVLDSYIENEVTFYHHDIAADTSSLGGPIYNGDGAVAGMLLTSSGAEEEGTAISCGDIKAFLATFGVNAQEQEEPEVIQEKPPMLNCALGMVLAVLLVLVIVRQVQSVRNLKSAEEAATDDEKAAGRKKSAARREVRDGQKMTGGQKNPGNRKVGGKKPKGCPLRKEIERLGRKNGRQAAMSQAASLEYPSERRIVQICKSNFLIGRAGEADFTFSGNRAISRRHACISCVDGCFYLSDLGSANHTYLNDVMLTPGEKRPLHDGDEVMVEKERLVFHINNRVK